jgi:alpha-D-xyloside xylohydrolase
MKFTDGFWNIRPGVTAHFASQAHEVVVGSNGMVVYAATKHLAHRGDTLNLPLLTARFSSPMENVIRVQICHHYGGLPKKPEFDLFAEDVPVKIEDGEQAATLTSGALSVRVEKQAAWKVDFTAEGHTLTSSGWRAMGFADTPAGRFIHEQLGLGVGECVYGLGERFTAFVKNGAGGGPVERGWRHQQRAGV